MSEDAKKKICFVIAPIGDPETEIRRRSDKILKHVIKVAVEPLGYHALRADQISEPGIITSQVIQHVVQDPLVIADLTGANANVFYELALRHALRLPFVQLIKKGEVPPFDVAGARTIRIDDTDLDSVEEAKSEISNQVQSLEKDSSKLETPISISFDLNRLRQSGDPEQRTLAEILKIVTELRNEDLRRAHMDAVVTKVASITAEVRQVKEEFQQHRAKSKEAVGVLSKAVAESREELDKLRQVFPESAIQIGPLHAKLDEIIRALSRLI